MIDECRFGCMTEDTHAFLHGKDTSVPGSWLNDKSMATCGVGCTQQKGECQTCQQERKRRSRVYHQGKYFGQSDPRIHSDHFKHAVSVVPNNDLKMEICKRGAAQWAREQRFAAEAATLAEE